MCDLAWSIRPLETVGGDFVLAAPLPCGRLFLLLGDAMGHGVDAHAMAVFVRAALYRSLQTGQHSPAGTLDLLNTLVARHFPEAFVTAVACLLDVENRTLTWSTAGHPPLLVRQWSGEVTYLSEPAAPLGLYPEPYTEQTCPLAANSTVLLYSDGISDALTAASQPLVGVLERTVPHGARTIVRTVVRTAQHSIRRHRNHADDQAVLAACVR